MSGILAEQFVRDGHELKLVTQTPGSMCMRFPYDVIRRPRPRTLLKLVQWAEVYFQNHISLRTAWPLLLVQRPWIVTHQTWISRMGGLDNWAASGKRFLLRYAVSLSISRAIAEDLPVPSVVIGNPYDDDVFYERPESQRTRDLIFVGRLVAAEGIYLILEAMVRLRKLGMAPRLTVVGAGPEETFLRHAAVVMGLATQTDFVGPKQGEELAELLNTHRILLAPSMWREPFGVVALEGVACGCVVVGSAGGGLEDAIGPCGVTFLNGDMEKLTRVLYQLLSEPRSLDTYRAHAPLHLAKFRKAVIAKIYLKVFEGALQNHRPLCWRDP